MIELSQRSKEFITSIQGSGTAVALVSLLEELTASLCDVRNMADLSESSLKGRLVASRLLEEVIQKLSLHNPKKTPNNSEFM